MTLEYPFILFILISGLAINSLFYKRLPFWFILTSSFFTGCINWVIVSLLVMVVAGKANTEVIASITALEFLACIFFFLRGKGYLVIQKRNLIFFFGFLVLFAFFEYLFCRFNITKTSTDTFTYIMMGKWMASNGLEKMRWSTPASIAFFISLMQTPAGFLGIDYLHSFQPIFSTSFILFVIAAANFHFSRKVGWIKANLISLIPLALLFSSSITVFEFSYIHTNLSSGCILFLALFCFYMFHEEGHLRGWGILGIIFLTGFSLLRVENILISIIFSLLLIKFLQFSYRERITYFIPYFVFSFLVESIILLARESSVKRSMLDTGEILGILGGIALMILFIVLSRMHFIEKVILPHLSAIMVGLYTIAVVFAFGTQFSHMLTSLTANLSNVFVTGGWGATWFIIILLYFFFLNKMKNPYLAILKFAIPFYFLTTLLISYFRVPYHEGWSDSANRIFTQILFVCTFYVMINLVELLNNSAQLEKSRKPNL